MCIGMNKSELAYDAMICNFEKLNEKINRIFLEGNRITPVNKLHSDTKDFYEYASSLFMDFAIFYPSIFLFIDFSFQVNGFMTRIWNENYDYVAYGKRNLFFESQLRNLRLWSAIDATRQVVFTRIYRCMASMKYKLQH
jgi:hypothetical protein